MQGMKPDATAVWIEYGRGEQMVEVDEHGEKENYIYYTPLRTKKDPGDEGRSEQVEAVMDDGLQRDHLDVNMQNIAYLKIRLC